MIELIVIVAVAAVSFFAGMAYREWQAFKKLENYVSFIRDLQREIDQATIRVHIVREGDTFFIYNKDTQEFLAQGKSPDEIKEVLTKRHPNKYFDADLENAKEVGYKLK